MSEPQTPADTYEPDPAAETAMVIDAFFGALSKRYSDEPDLVDRLRRRQDCLVAA